MFLKDKFQLMKYLLNVFATLFWSVVIFPFFPDTNCHIGAIPSSFGVILVFTLISNNFFVLVLNHLGLIFIESNIPLAKPWVLFVFISSISFIIGVCVSSVFMMFKMLFESTVTV